MKHLVSLLVVLLALIVPVVPASLDAQTSHKRATPVVSSPEDIAKAIQQLESDLRIATMKGEASWFEQHLAETFIETDAAGKAHNRADILRLYRNTQPEYDAWNLSEGTAQTFHGNTVVLTGKLDLEGKVGGKNISGTFRFIRIWIKDGLDWKLAAEQMTKIAG
jgi:hypothetical protein